MARPKRYDFQGALHLVTISGYPGGSVFYDPGIFARFPKNPCAHAPDANRFESLLWDVCEQYDARVHAYLIDSNATQLIIQTVGAPLPWLVHDLLARYSTHLINTNRIRLGQRPFPRRYRAQLVQPAKLPYAVRCIHRRENAIDSRRRMINNPFSSNLIHSGRKVKPKQFVVNMTREALYSLGYRGLDGYFEFMARGDSPTIADMLSRRIVGEADFIEAVQKRLKQPPKVPTPDQILEGVTGTLLHAASDVVCSSSHRGALARALVAWYAMRAGTAQIGAVGQWFGVTSSGLRYLIRKHRNRSPHYFAKTPAELFPPQ